MKNKLKFYYSSEQLAKVASNLIPIPSNPFKYDVNVFIHWHVFRVLHLGVESDKIEIIKQNLLLIRSIEEAQIRRMSPNEIFGIGIVKIS